MEKETIKLDIADRRILTELDINCRISATQLAKKVRKSREAVKYRIRQLEEKGIITGYLTSINPNKFGFYMFKVYLQLENIPQERQKFYEFLRTRKNIYWYGISDGAFDCIFAILSRGITEYYEEINAICAQFRKLIVRKLLGVMVDTAQYNKKYFIENAPQKSVVFAGNVVHNKLDGLDFEIIDILANDARIPLTKLAHKAKSTVEIVRRRMRRMEELGIILSYRIDVDINKLGYEFFKAIIYFKSLSHKEELALMEWMKQEPHSVYYIRSLAPWEAEFEFVVENYLQFNKIIDEMRQKFPNVIRNCEHVIFMEERWMPGYGAIAAQKS
jgi:Lrp/AsnC family leucine-responsive transcriptional regulator